MTVYLDIGDVLAAAEAFLGHAPAVRDLGLLGSAVARPRAGMFGVDAYPALEAKAAALIHSLVTNDGLMDENERLGVVGMILFLALNGCHLTMSDDALYELTMTIASGELDDVGQIADRLVPHIA